MTAQLPLSYAPQTSPADRNRALGALGLTALIWGLTPVATRILVLAVPAADLLLIRFVISAMLYASLLAAIGGWKIDRTDVWRFAFVGVTGVTGYNALMTYGLATTPAGLGGLILGTEPLCIAVFAAVLLGEPIGVATGLGLTLAAAGTIVLVLGDWTVSGMQGGAAALTGALLVFAGSVSWSLSVIVSKPLLKTYGAMRTSAISSLIGFAPIMVLVSPRTVAVTLELSPLQWVATAFLAVFGTVLSILLWNFGIRFVESARAAAFIYVVPLVSVMAGVVVLHEALTGQLILGGVLILAGVGIAQFAPR